MDALVGAKHTFAFHGTSVTIELPDKPSDKHSDKIWKLGGHVSGDPALDRYEIGQIDVLVDLDQEVYIHPRMLEIPPKHPEFLTPEETEHLNETAARQARLAQDIYLYWVKVMRWCARSSRIAERPVATLSSGWSTDLMHTKTRHRFWSATQMITVSARPVMPDNKWNEAQTLLSAGFVPPLWFDLLVDGEQRIRSGDLWDGTLNVAISAELICREVFQKNFDKVSGPGINEILDRVTVSQIFDRHIRKIVGEEHGPVLKTVQDLITARNKLAHKGTISLDDQKCAEFTKGVRQLAEILGRW